MEINSNRMLNRIKTLGQIGVGSDGRRIRLEASDGNKQARDTVVAWMKEAGIEVVTDYIGNIFGIWQTKENAEKEPFMTGSHIDTVINAGQYDGCYGVIAALEVIQTLKDSGFKPCRPIVMGIFSNEEGVRFAPDMMGSAVYAKAYPLESALKSIGTDGKILGDELKRIGYEGTVEPGFIKPYAFVELHIEQGPIMDSEGCSIGAVENLQGISWFKIKINGAQNHAGTTPISYRHDAGLAAAKVITFMRERCEIPGSKSVSTIGCISFSPNAVNVIPETAEFTVDVRDPNEEVLQKHEEALLSYLKMLEEKYGLVIDAERISRFRPVDFDEGICRKVEKYASERGLSCRRMISGAGQDAQNMALLCPTAMIFVPSVNGISHNPKEFTKEEDLINGANVLLDVTKDYSLN